MLRASQFSTLLFLALRITVLSPLTAGQSFNPTWFPDWDSTNQVLFFGRGSPSPIVRAYVDAHQRGADIELSKDFPGIQSAYIDNLAAGPDGTTFIAVTLNFGDHNMRELVLTYDSTGQLLKTWDPAPQYIEAMAYSKDDDALFVLGGRDLPPGPYAPTYPLLIEYRRDGRIMKTMAPVGILKERENSFNLGGQNGEPLLRVTKDRIYFYASTNREAVVCDRDGVVLAYRSFSDAVEKISTEDGYHLVQTHQSDFAENGDLVAELLLWNDSTNNYVMEVVRLSMKSGEAVSVHKDSNSGRLWFVGMKDDQYLYLEHLEGGQNLYTQSAAGQEPKLLITEPIN